MRMPKTIGLSLALLAVSVPAVAKQAEPKDHQTSAIRRISARAATAAGCGNGGRAEKRHAAVTLSGRRRPRAAQRASALPPPDQYLGPVRVVGQREVGSAAWYGGYHLGRRTASGDRLDAVHATAAHRSLPLLSLVRVTNLGNGRSVIVKITDRGPVSHSLLIDVSPRVARELDMVRSGIAKVSVEPVVPERLN